MANRDGELMALYEAGDSAEEISEKMGYKVSTVKQKLTEWQVYDPPVSANYIRKIWQDWERACDRLKGDSMRINLTEGYYITVDSYNWILNKKYVVEKGDSKGKEKHKPVGYYSRLKSCIMGYLDRVGVETSEDITYEMADYADHCDKAVKDAANYIVEHIGELVIERQRKHK